MNDVPKARRQKPRAAPKSLAAFVQALHGMPVLVETRYDMLIRGILDDADQGMNLTLSGVTVERMADGHKQQDLPFLYLRARMVRYVHIPPQVNIKTAIEERRNKVRNLRQRHKKDTANLQHGSVAKGEQRWQLPEEEPADEEASYELMQGLLWSPERDAL